MTQLLSTMSQDELKSVQAQIKFLLNDSGQPSKEEYLTEDQSLFYNEMIKVLRQFHVRNILENEGKSLKPRLKGFKLDSFRQGYQNVQDFLIEQAPDLSSVLRVRFYAILSDALACYIMGQGQTIGIKRMIIYLDEIEEVFENGFPGYLRNNLFIRILEAYQ